LTGGFALPSGLCVYCVSNLVERNDTYEVTVYCPGFLLIGDDSGGRGLLISTNEPNLSVYRSDLGDLSVEGFEEIAASIEDWIATL
jgi:hypothetical protein